MTTTKYGVPRPAQSGTRTRVPTNIGGQVPNLNVRFLEATVVAYSVVTAALITPRTVGPGGQARVGVALYPDAALFPAANVYPSSGTGTRRLGTLSVTNTGSRPLATTVTATSTVTGALVATNAVTLVPAGVIRGGILSPSQTLFPAVDLFPQSGVGGRSLGSPSVVGIGTLSGIVTTTSATVGLMTVRAGLAGTAAATSAVTANLSGGFPTARRLGVLTVTLVGMPRPIGQARVRRLGTLAVSGRTITVTGQLRTRAVGTPTVRGILFPIGAMRTRRLGSLSVNARTVTTTAITHTRGIGAAVVTVVWIARPASQTHTRAVGSLTARGRLIVGPPSLTHVRRQGVPQLSGRVITTGLVHTRVIGTPEVNVRFLMPVGLTRA